MASDGVGDLKLIGLFPVFERGMHAIHLNVGLGFPTGSIDHSMTPPARVQSVLAPRQGVRNAGTRVLPEGSFPTLRFLETDSILQVSQVFKGPESIRQVVISQKGGVLGSYTELPTQYNLMQQGEHYILFLTDEARSDLPDVTGIPRYGLNGAWTGMFQIDEGGVHVSPDTVAVIREQFDGRSSEDVITEIQNCS